jgi:hypothetical protein
MNKCILQIWEESERGWGTRPGGCSLHITDKEHSLYLDSIYSNRGDLVPNEYESVVGEPIICFVSDIVYGGVKEFGSVRLLESEKNNLIKMEEIIFNNL